MYLFYVLCLNSVRLWVYIWPGNDFIVTDLNYVDTWPSHPCVPPQFQNKVHKHDLSRLVWKNLSGLHGALTSISPNTFWMSWNADCTLGLLTWHQCPASLILLWLNRHKIHTPKSSVIPSQKSQGYYSCKGGGPTLEWDVQRAYIGTTGPYSVQSMNLLCVWLKVLIRSPNWEVTPEHSACGWIRISTNRTWPTASRLVPRTPTRLSTSSWDASPRRTTSRSDIQFSSSHIFNEITLLNEINK